MPEFFHGGVQSHAFRVDLKLLCDFELLHDDASESLFGCAYERFSTVYISEAEKRSVGVGTI